MPKVKGSDLDDFPLIITLQPISKIASAVVMAIGCLVLLGWLLDIAALKSIIPGLVTMKPNAAIAFILSGASLWLLDSNKDQPGTKNGRRNRWRIYLVQIGQLSALIVAIFGLLTLCEFIFNWNLGIDRLLFPDKLDISGNFPAGRIAPNTALNFLLCGIALIVLSGQQQRHYLSAQTLTLINIFVALQPIIGYAYGFPSLSSFATYKPMALNTALSFLVLGVGILFIKPEVGLLKLIASDRIAGFFARRLFIAAMVIPSVLGWFIIQGERSGLYDIVLGVPLLVLGSIVLFGILIWQTAQTLEQIDNKRRQAEAALRQSEERYRAFIEQSAEAIWRFELEQPVSIELGEDEQIEQFYQYGYLAECNNAMAQMYGFGCAAEIIGTKLADLLISSESQNINLLREFIRSGYQLSHAESHEFDQAGNPKFFSNNLVGIIENGFLVRAWGTQRDITERKEAQEALQLSEIRFRTLVEQSPLSKQILTPDGKTIQVNRAWEQLWGVTLDQIPEYNILEDEQLVAKGIMPYIKAGFAGEPTEIPGIIYDPNESIPDRTIHKEPQRWVKAFIYPVKDDTGKIREIVLIHEDITAAKNAEEALRLSEARFRRLVESNIVGVLVANLSGEIVQANDAFLQMIGYTQAELLAKEISWLKMTPPEYLEQDARVIEQIKSTGVCPPFEKEYIRKDGTRVPLVLACAALAESTDSTICFALDLSDRKQAEIALRDSEEKFRQLAENIHQVFWMVETKTTEIIYISPAYEEIWGCTCQSLYESSRSFVDAIHPEDREQVLATFKLQWQGEQTSQEYRIIRPDGKLRWIWDRAFPIKDESGQVYRVAGIAEDITERKWSENALKESEDRFRKLTEKVRVIPWEANPVTGNFTYVGPQAVDIAGYPWEEWYTDDFWLEHIHHEDREQAIKYCLESSAYLDNYEFEYRMLTTDGRIIWFYDIVNVVRHKGELQLLRGFLIDITERKRAEQEREQLLASEQLARHHAEATNRMKDEFLAVLSHELRTPLNSMLGWTQLLRTRKFDQNTISRALETIDRNTKSLAQLIEDVLDVSRIITGKLVLNLYQLELIPIIETAIDTVRSMAEAKQIHLEVNLGDLNGQILGDSTRLQQIVWNLLTNAIKFTPRQGRVEVRVNYINSYVQIQVTDSGQGIKPEFLPYVFERFRQADSSTTRSHGGLGLGLAIVRHLVDLHGGTVRADSLGVGQGATFTVTLPLLEAHQAEQEINHEKSLVPNGAASAPLSGIQILIVDDEVDNLELLSTLLSEDGAQVNATTSAEEALAAVKILKPDILISDIAMPQTDGYALIRQIRLLKPDQGGSIPAIALTAYASKEDKVRSLDAGFQVHIAKPVDPIELSTAIISLLK